MKIALLTNTPAPYRLSFYEEWSNLDDVVVVFDRLEASGRSWVVDPGKAAIRFEALGSHRFSLKERRSDLRFSENRTIYFSTKVFSALKRLKPDVVVTTEFGSRSLMAAAYCKLSKTPLILTNEATCHTERLTRGLRPCLRRWLVRCAQGFWSNGRDSSEFLMRHGARRTDIQEGMTGVDTHLFTDSVAARVSQREHIRARLGIQGTAMLVLGSVSGRKGVPQLREAVSWLAANRPDLHFSIIFLGNGDEMVATQNWAAALPASIKVIFPGFVQIDGVPDYLVAADWGLMPTLEDCWPLSTLEMVLAGLPQLFSIYNGGTAELCREGITGFPFDPAQRESFTSALEMALGTDQARLDQTVIAEFRDMYSPGAQARRASESCLRVLLKAK